MSNKTGFARDPFTFSLGGLTTIASFVPAPVLADNRIRQDRRRLRTRAANERDGGCDRGGQDCRSAA